MNNAEKTAAAFGLLEIYEIVLMVPHSEALCTALWLHEEKGGCKAFEVNLCT